MVWIVESVFLRDMTKRDEIEQRRGAFNQLLKTRDIKVAELARRSKVPASTIYSFTRGDTDSMTGVNESAIAAALGLNKDDLYDGGEAKIIEPTYVRVIGQVQAGAWMETSDFESEETIPMAPEPRFSGRRQFALKVQGPSMNLIIPGGDYVLCVDWSDTGLVPTHGQIVVVRRQRGQLIETTLKQIEINGDGVPILMPRSDDPRFQDPVRLVDGHQDGAEDVEVAIAALVVGRYQALF